MTPSSDKNKAVATTSLSKVFNGVDSAVMMGLFSGNAIPDVGILSSLYSGGNTPTCAQVASALGLTSSTVLGVLALPANNSSWVNNKLVIPLSSITSLMQVTQTGVPKFAVFRLSGNAATANTFAEFASSSYTCKELLIVSVGDEKSTAEIQILGGSVTSGKQYTMTDLVISL